jgi:hypothetical protein
MVGGNNSVTSLKTAILGYMKSGKIVYLDCISVTANYIATKTVIATKAQLVTLGKELDFDIIYKDYEIENSRGSNIKTGIRWILQDA